MIMIKLLFPQMNNIVRWDVNLGLNDLILTTCSGRSVNPSDSNGPYDPDIKIEKNFTPYPFLSGFLVVRVDL